MKNINCSKIIVSAIFSIGAALFLTSCNPKEGGGSQLKGISLSEHELVMSTEGEQFLKCLPVPSTATLPYVEWSSSDEDVVYVDNAGYLTAGVIPGVATISVSTVDGKFKDECVVIVSVSATSLVLSQTEPLFLEINDSFTLTASVLPSEADQTIQWSSLDPSVATVDDGVVKAVAKGNTKIVAAATTGDIQEECMVTVTEPVLLVGLSLTTQTLKPGDVVSAGLVYEPENTTRREVTWTSSDEDVISVDAGGMLTAKNEGVATITVTSKDGSISKTCDIPVVESKCIIKSTKSSYYLQLAPTNGECWVDLNGNGLLDAGEKMLKSDYMDYAVKTISKQEVTVYGPAEELKVESIGNAKIDITKAGTLSHLSAILNDSFELVADQTKTYTNLKKISCYMNNLSSGRIVSSLPKVTSGELIYKWASSSYTETNSAMDISAAKEAMDKGWIVKDTEGTLLVGDNKITLSGVKSGSSLTLQAVRTPGLESSCWIDLNGDGECQTSEKITTDNAVEYRVNSSTIVLNGAIKELYFSREDVTGIDATYYHGFLEKLCIPENSLNKLSLNGMKQLKHLDCKGNAAEMLNIKYCPNLEYLDCSNNRLSDGRMIDGDSALKTIKLYGNKFTIGQLEVFSNLLSRNDGNIVLLDVSDYHLGEKNVVDKTVVDRFENITWTVKVYCNGTEREITPADYDTIAEVVCRVNKADLFDMSVKYYPLHEGEDKCYYYLNDNLTNQKYLSDIISNTLPVSPGYYKTFSFFGSFDCLDLSGNSRLEYVTTKGPGLKTLDVGKCPNLTKVDLSGAVDIKTIVCNQCWIGDGLILSPDLEDLSHISCYGNHITNIDVKLLPDRTGKTAGTIDFKMTSLSSEDNSLTPSQVSAIKRKNWVVRYSTGGRFQYEYTGE